MDKKIENMTIEQLITELEAISEKIEFENVSLEKSVELYERGNLLAQTATERISKLQARINIVTPEGEEPFELPEND